MREPASRLPKRAAHAVAAAVWLCLGAPAVAYAQAPAPVSPPSQLDILAQRAKALDALFESLRAASSRAEAEELTAEIWRQWRRSGRAEIDLLMQQAAAAVESRNHGLAVILLDEVVEAAPDFSEGWNQRATLRFKMGDHAGSLADIDRTLALEPRHFGALAGQGMIHMAAKRWREALASYRKALPYYRFNTGILTLISDLEKQIKDEKL